MSTIETSVGAIKNAVAKINSDVLKSTLVAPALIPNLIGNATQPFPVTEAAAPLAIIPLERALLFFALSFCHAYLSEVFVNADQSISRFVYGQVPPLIRHGLSASINTAFLYTAIVGKF